MSSAIERAVSILNGTIGVESPPGDWHTVTQDQIDAFARTTLDNQFIHTDAVCAARESPFGTTIAHGFLTLSLISHLVKSIPPPKDDPEQGRAVGLITGWKKSAFLLPCGSTRDSAHRQALLAVEKRTRTHCS